jgi:hypothetical protein
MRHEEKKITIVVPFRQADSLTELTREGARPMLAEALKAEADTFVAQLVGWELPDGRHHVVRHGHAAVRTILAEIGPIALQRAKVGEGAAVSRALEDLVQDIFPDAMAGDQRDQRM